MDTLMSLTAGRSTVAKVFLKTDFFMFKNFFRFGPTSIGWSSCHPKESNIVRLFGDGIGFTAGAAWCCGLAAQGKARFCAFIFGSSYEKMK